MLTEMKVQKGMTLMSVLIATALSGVIGLMVIRLISNQAEAMLVVKLREEREILIKHYRQVIIGGWDKTMATTTTPKTINTRGGQTFPFSLKEKLYDPLASGVGWWEVEATIDSSMTALSGEIQHSDAYSQTTGLHRERNYVVKLTVSFDPEQHPVVDIKLAPRQEVIYMGYRWQQTTQSGCGSDSTIALTRRNTASDKPLYHPNDHDSSDDVISGQGAIVSYSLHSNYIKCSQVPLVSNETECPTVSAILGFESWHKDTRERFYRKNRADEYVTGRLACSYPVGASNTPEGKWKTALGNERYYTLHNRVWDITSTPHVSSTDCPALDKSYIDSVTSITTTGNTTKGGELICESALIAPQLFSHYYDRTTATSNLVTDSSATGALGDYRSYTPGDDAGHPAGLNDCIRYSSYDGSTNKPYDDHVGGGGYKDDHSGGLKRFVSTGSGSGARTDPFEEHSNSRGVPGDRGAEGECECGNP